MNINVRLTKGVGKILHDRAARALADITEDALREAREVVPLEEATLSRSGFAQVDAATLRGQVAFDTPYAVVQHEDPTLKHDGGRKHHYLSDTVEQNRKRHVTYLQGKVAGK